MELLFNGQRGGGEAVVPRTVSGNGEVCLDVGITRDHIKVIHISHAQVEQAGTA